MTYQFHDHNEPDAADVEIVRTKLKAFNESVLGDYSARPLLVTATSEDGTLVGAVYGWLQFNWLFIHLVWVDETHRRRRIATRLMDRIEALACQHGIHRSRLATSDVQPGFHLYRQRGYEVFAEIPFSNGDGPDDHTEYLMWKHRL